MVAVVDIIIQVRVLVIDINHNSIKMIKVIIVINKNNKIVIMAQVLMIWKIQIIFTSKEVEEQEERNQSNQTNKTRKIKVMIIWNIHMQKRIARKISLTKRDKKEWEVNLVRLIWVMKRILMIIYMLINSCHSHSTPRFQKCLIHPNLHHLYRSRLSFQIHHLHPNTA